MSTQEQESKQDRLEHIVQLDGTVQAYLTGAGLTKDVYRKRILENKALEELSKTHSFLEYQRAIFYFLEHGSSTKASNLECEMYKYYPLLGRLTFVPLRIAASLDIWQMESIATDKVVEF